jgi:membrane protease YdiL (CAAX protease family)
MIGILVELLISWLLLKYIQKQNLWALGLKPNWQRISELFAGLLWPVIYVGLFQYIVSLLVHNPYKLNPNYNLKAFWNINAYLFRSVAYEDLIFRGALLYILIKRLGPQKAVLISAIAFGIYHWFSFGVIGNPIQMAIVFLLTGAGGYV